MDENDLRKDSSMLRAFGRKAMYVTLLLSRYICPSKSGLFLASDGTLVPILVYPHTPLIKDSVTWGYMR